MARHQAPSTAACTAIMAIHGGAQGPDLIILATMMMTLPKASSPSMKQIINGHVPVPPHTHTHTPHTHTHTHTPDGDVDVTKMLQLIWKCPPPNKTTSLTSRYVNQPPTVLSCSQGPPGDDARSAHRPVFSSLLPMIRPDHARDASARPDRAGAQPLAAGRARAREKEGGRGTPGMSRRPRRQ